MLWNLIAKGKFSICKNYVSVTYGHQPLWLCLRTFVYLWMWKAIGSCAKCSIYSQSAIKPTFSLFLLFLPQKMWNLPLSSSLWWGSRPFWAYRSTACAMTAEDLILFNRSHFLFYLPLDVFHAFLHKGSFWTSRLKFLALMEIDFFLWYEIVKYFKCFLFIELDCVEVFSRLYRAMIKLYYKVKAYFTQKMESCLWSAWPDSVTLYWFAHVDG